MLLVVLANNGLKEEFLSRGISREVQVEWIVQPEEFKNYPAADAFFDLLFENDQTRTGLLGQLTAQPVFINTIIPVKSQQPFIRVNGWNTFLERPVIEAACGDEQKRTAAENIFSALNRKTEWTPDIAGFVSARVVAMIINEAYFALEENVSTKEEIDTAMKLGTNYPYGPFEWSVKIGLKNVYSLLEELSKTEKRYRPAERLKLEAG